MVKERAVGGRRERMGRKGRKDDEEKVAGVEDEWHGSVRRNSG